MIGCETPARDLTELVVVDSVYVDPTLDEPWTGPVYRRFEEDSARVQIQGTLLDGEWHGEMTVYHANGAVRYMGSFRNGERCGPWTENADSVPTGTVYEALVREVETLGMYPSCDPGSGGD